MEIVHHNLHQASNIKVSPHQTFHIVILSFFVHIVILSFLEGSYNTRFFTSFRITISICHSEFFAPTKVGIHKTNIFLLKTTNDSL